MLFLLLLLKLALEVLGFLLLKFCLLHLFYKLESVLDLLLELLLPLDHLV